MGRQRRDDVQHLFRSGVDAMVATAGSFGPNDWERQACGSWTTTETARHVLAVVRWYHDWLDRAERGDHSLPFPESEINERNDAALGRLTHLSGPAAIEEFVNEASRYIDRVTEHWDLVYAYPFGVVTAGLHCGVAATEWHLHASDLAASVGVDLQPDEPRQLFIAAGSCLATASGGARGAVLRRLVPIAAYRSPWDTILRQTGRAEPKRRGRSTATRR